MCGVNTVLILGRGILFLSIANLVRTVTSLVHRFTVASCSVAPILYRLSVYRPKILVSAIGNITKCLLVTKILHFYGKIDHKIVKLCTER